ncbi:MAG TPA: ATP-binding protein [Beijerinckiaceae bacterium]|nr:ATP-binding protein [Beijerinckiaceae bacterium]
MRRSKERIGGMHIEPHNRADLSLIAREAADHMGPLILAKGRTIEVVGAERPLIINAARDFLFRAVRHLVENAMEHTPKGTAVTIVVRDPPAIDVIDYGPGIPTDQRQNVVTRFWQGHRDRLQGAAIGLSIVQQTVAGHGALLEIGENQGGGAMFSIVFPNSVRLSG